jgi:hypothetical protein
MDDHALIGRPPAARDTRSNAFAAAGTAKSRAANDRWNGTALSQRRARQATINTATQACGAAFIMEQTHNSGWPMQRHLEMASRLLILIARPTALAGNRGGNTR